LNQADLIQHLESLGVTSDGIAYVLASAEQPHAIPSESHARKNITGEFASGVPASIGNEAMDWRLPFDSLSGEFAYHVIVQSDPLLLFALDHPNPVSLTIKDRTDRSRRISYTPDGLRVTTEGVWVEEVKSREDLLTLCETHGGNWSNENGRFHYHQAENAFRAMGLNFSVVVREELSWLRVQNLLLLRSMVAKYDEHYRYEYLHEIHLYVEQTGYCSIADIVEKIPLSNAGAVFIAIAAGELHVDLDRANLADAHSKFLSGTMVGAKDIGILLSTVQTIAATSESVDLLDLCDPKHIKEFAYRAAIVCGQSTEGVDRSLPCQRTIQRWKKAYAEAGYTGLIPKFSNCGKKEAHIPHWHMELVRRTMKLHRSSQKYFSRTRSHCRYKRGLRLFSHLRNFTETPISYSHYCRLWNTRKHSTEDALGKGGNRLANSLSPHKDVDQQNLTAVRPFQVAHIDHCYAPTVTEHTELGRTGQPWLTVLVDDFNSEPLASVIRFDPPSFVSDALVLRDCQRRHGRLPETMFSDGGSNFRSTMFRACLASLQIHWFKRSSAYAKSGQPAERTFLTFANTSCAGKVGFVPDIVNLRSIDRAKHPRKGPRRAWDAFVADTNHILFDVLPNLACKDGSPSSREARREFENLYGPQGNLQKRDLRFLVATANPLECTGTTEPAGAIRTQDTRFYSTELFGKSVSVRGLFPRQDPEDPTVLYFKIASKWRVAKTRSALRERGREDSAIQADLALREPLTKKEREERTDAMHRTSTVFVPAQRGTKEAEDVIDEPQNSIDEKQRKSTKFPSDWGSVDSFPLFDEEHPEWIKP